MRISLPITAALLCLSYSITDAQAPDWVTVELSTPDVAAATAGISNSGIMAWIEINAGMAQVYRRTTDGNVALVIEHVGTMGNIGGNGGGFRIPVTDLGVVVSSHEDPARRGWDKYADDVLANFASGGDRVSIAGQNYIIDSTSTDSGLPRLVSFDISNSTRNVYAYSDAYRTIDQKAANDDGQAFLSIQGRDPADDGIYLWDNGVLTKEPLVGLPTGHMASGLGGADMKGTKLAYVYEAIGDANVKQNVVVTKDLVTGQSSSLVMPLVEIQHITVDATGRAIYYKREFGIPSLHLFDGNTEQLLATDLAVIAQPNVNSFGEIVFVKTLQGCQSGVPDPDCKSDVYYLDLDSGVEKQVTNMPAGSYVWNATISDTGDIVYVFVDKAQPAIGSDDNDPAQSVGAAIIDVVPPTAPSNLGATPISQTQIDLAWDASIEAVALDAYDVFRNDVLIGTTSSTSFQDTGLASNTTYTYKAEAFDLAGNRSVASTPATASTFAPPPPPTPTPSSGGGGGSTSLLFLGLLVLSRAFLSGGNRRLIDL